MRIKLALSFLSIYAYPIYEYICVLQTHNNVCCVVILTWNWTGIEELLGKLLDYLMI